MMAVRSGRLKTMAALKPGDTVWLRWHAGETAVYDAAS
jgi:hypothetical protein